MKLGRFGGLAYHLLSLFNLGSVHEFTRVRPAPSIRRRKTTLHSTNGKREVNRRLRQIAEGRLTVSNGLVA